MKNVTNEPWYSDRAIIKGTKGDLVWIVLVILAVAGWAIWEHMTS